MTSKCKNSAFTLIEIAIVLVVIGLIVGGVLVGRELINAASVRSQISQIEKYQQAVNAFRGKYGYLPGDIPEPDATRFGFQARGTHIGEGDGNGLIQGWNAGGTGGDILIGEPILFWVDLSFSKLVEGSFTQPYTNGVGVSGTGADFLMPKAKLGNTSNIYVFSGISWTGAFTSTGINYFGHAANVGTGGGGGYNTGNAGFTPAGLTVKEAYSIDKKIDDGLPTTGNTLAGFGTQITSTITGTIPAYVNGDPASAPLPYQTLGTVATAGSALTCFDNSNNTSNAMQYSILQNNGGGVNCALSFKFQ